MNKSTWLIIILIGVLFLQYAYPDKISWATDPTLGKAKDYIGNNNPVDTIKNKITSGCTSTYEPVCGSNSVTYNNTCLAGLDGVVAVTSGVC